MKQQPDKNQRDVELHVGQLVLVKLRPYRKSSVRERRYTKLSQRYFVPFKITELEKFHVDSNYPLLLEPPSFPHFGFEGL